MTEAWHLYEVVISNSHVWLKLQASSPSSESATVNFKHRFSGPEHDVDGHHTVTPFKALPTIPSHY